MDTATDTQPASGQVNLPNGGQVTSEQQSPEEKAGAMQSWMNTAGGSSPAKPPTQPQAAAGPGTASPAAQPAAQPVPVPVTSLKRGGILGVMDSVADVLVGKQKPELGKDPQGNLYIKEHTMTHGEQWARIAGEAMRGAAAGLAAGKGAGNMAKAPLAGMQAQEQAQTQEYDQMQKKVLDNANNQMLRMQMAEQSWKAGRLGVDAMQHDITFWQGQRDRLEKEGATYLGDTAHAGDISHLRAANPDIMKDLVENHSLEFIPKPGEDGKIQGFAVYKTPTKYGTDILPVGQEFPTYNNMEDRYDWHKTVTPITQKEYDDYWTSAGNAALKFRNDKKEGELKTAQIATQGATKTNLLSEAATRNAKLPGEIAETSARARQANATADLDDQKRQQIKTGQATTDGTPNPTFELMAQGMLNGDILPADLKRQAKGAGLDPNALIGRAMELAQANGQQFSLPIIEQEHKFASNPKTQAALDGIDRILGAPGAPGYMQQMLDLAKQADLTDVGFVNNPMLWVKRQWGDTAAKNFDTSIQETRRSIAGLIGNPLLGGSETDKKLEQAKEMLGGSPTMANLQGAANVLEQALKTQRDSMTQNNRYLRKRYGTVGTSGSQGGAAQWSPPPGAAPGAAVAAVPQPAGATKKVPGPDGKNHWTNDQGTVDLGIAP